MSFLLAASIDELRYEPTPKRVRAYLGDSMVIDTRRALLVWEPRRIVPAYAVPIDEISGVLIPAANPQGQTVDIQAAAVLLDPSVPFAQHSCSGEEFDVAVNGRLAGAAAFQPNDVDTCHHVILRFDAFDWFEEDEPILSHPRDPFRRIDALTSSRHVTVETSGIVLADSTQPVVFFETSMPVRCYLPRDDVLVALQRSAKTSLCAYKGRASYFSVTDGARDIAWSYEDPLLDAKPVRNLICFFDEHVNVFIDGELQDRPITSWS